MGWACSIHQEIWHGEPHALTNPAYSVPSFPIQSEPRSTRHSHSLRGNALPEPTAQTQTAIHSNPANTQSRAALGVSDFFPSLLTMLFVALSGVGTADWSTMLDPLKFSKRLWCDKDSSIPEDSGHWSIICLLKTRLWEGFFSCKDGSSPSSAVLLVSIVDIVTHVGLQVPASAILHSAFMTFILKVAAHQSNPVISPEPSDFFSSSLPSLASPGCTAPYIRGNSSDTFILESTAETRWLFFHQLSTVHESSIPLIKAIPETRAAPPRCGPNPAYRAASHQLHQCTCLGWHIPRREKRRF